MIGSILRRITLLNVELLMYKRSSLSSVTSLEPSLSIALKSNTRKDYLHGRKAAIEELGKLFGLRPYGALELVVRFKQLQNCTVKNIRENYYLLRRSDISNETMLKYGDILANPKLDSNLSFLKQLSFNIKDTIPLVNLKKPIVPSKIEEYIRLLQNLFEIPVNQVCHDVSRRQFLLDLSIEKIDTNFRVLKSFDIETGDIRRDLWVMRYNSDTISQRLKLALDLKADKLKTWMVRVPETVLHKSIQRVHDNKSILGDNSIAEYFVSRLECSIEESSSILDKYPPLVNKNLKMFNLIIETLIYEGYTKLQIVQNPKILLHSIDTTLKRLRELQSKGVKHPGLHVLMKSKTNYQTYLETFDKSKKEKTALS